VIVAAAVCPHPPLLFRELTGRHDVAGPLREACVAAVRETTAAAARVAVVGGADRSGSFDPAAPAGVRGFGTTARRADDTGPALPLSLGVATRLLGESGWDVPVDLRGIAWDASPAEVAELGADLATGEEPTALLVLGDGSARRGDTAAGYLDQRAFPFDEATGRALAAGDPDGLLDLDAGLAARLMAGGRAALQVLGAAVREQGSEVEARMLYQDDPFGVMYFVAVWRCRQVR
jgi:hypothetical protein